MVQSGWVRGHYLRTEARRRGSVGRIWSGMSGHTVVETLYTGPLTTDRVPMRRWRGRAFEKHIRSYLGTMSLTPETRSSSSTWVLAQSLSWA